MAFLHKLDGLANRYGMQMRSCSNPEQKLPPSQCIGRELFLDYGEGVGDDILHGPSRSGCQCIKTIDIGMDNTCMGGCKYCYVVVSHKTSVKNYQNHDPEGMRIR